MPPNDTARVRAAVLVAPKTIAIQTFPCPATGREDGLLAVEAAGVCGTDAKFYNGKIHAPYPVILGHEIVGKIETAGAEAAKRWSVGPGDMVVVESAVSCGVCATCQEGLNYHCPSRTGYGIDTSCADPPHLYGGFGERMYLAPQSVMNRVPANVSPVLATLVSPLSNAIEWTGVAQIEIGDVVVVQGVGQQGLACCVAARERGAGRIIASGLGRDRQRLDAALRLGADVAIDVEESSLLDSVRELTGGRLADVVIDASGSTEATRLSIDLVRAGGTVILAGLAGDQAQVTLEVDKLVDKHIRLQGVMAKQPAAVRKALQLLASGRYDFQPLITHCFGLEDTETALRLAAGGDDAEGVIKVVITPGGRT